MQLSPLMPCLLHTQQQSCSYGEGLNRGKLILDAPAATCNYKGCTSWQYAPWNLLTTQKGGEKGKDNNVPYQACRGDGCQNAYPKNLQSGTFSCNNCTAIESVEWCLSAFPALGTCHFQGAVGIWLTNCTVAAQGKGRDTAQLKKLSSAEVMPPKHISSGFNQNWTLVLTIPKSLLLVGFHQKPVSWIRVTEELAKILGTKCPNLI